MTGPEFTEQFQRLCRGFKHDATQEQAEAWFERVGQITRQVWVQSVTTLLLGKYFPKWDEVADVIEAEAENQRKAAVYRDQPKAKQLHDTIESGEGTALSPALFNAIKAFCGREQIRHYLVLVQDKKRPWKWTAKDLSVDTLTQQEKALTVELAKWLPLLTETELTEFIDRYGGNAVAA